MCNVRRLCFILFTSICQGLSAQHLGIPLRVDTCTNCKGTGINPFRCPVCRGTGQYGVRRVEERCPACAGGSDNCHVCNGTGRKVAIYPEMCRACAGGRPYRCPHCKNGFANIVDICKRDLKRIVPLWSHFDCVEDIFFIGNAEIDNSITIQNHKLIRVRKGSIEKQDLKCTYVRYLRDSIFAKTDGMMGMFDYEDDFFIVGGYSIPDSIITCHIHEPRMQRRLHKDSEPMGKRYCYKAVWVNDSTYNAGGTYMITPSHITSGHEEYFFENGLLTKKVSHGRSLLYKYLELDEKGNWLIREEYTDSAKEGRKEVRTIKYI